MCYHNPVVVTLDTNVLFQAFHSARGASHAMLRLVRTGEIEMAVSVPVFEEYRDVFNRSSTKTLLGLGDADVDAILAFVVTVGRATPISFSWRPNLRNEADNMFVELAIASGSRYLVTRNVRDMTVGADLRNDDISVVTPAQFMREWRAT